MNKELKDHIDAIPDDELGQYAATVQILERFVDILGVSIVLLIIIFTSIFTIIVGIPLLVFLSMIGITVKEARIYIHSLIDSE